MKSVRGHLVLLVSTALLGADAVPLSDQKQELLRLKREQVKEQTETGKTGWISPLQLSLTYDKTKDAINAEGETKGAAVGLNQDVFRSGGIFYSVEQAEASGRAGLLAVDREEAEYLKQLYTLKAQVERDTLKLHQSELTLKNRDIDLMITRAKYKAGSADISELNRVTLDRDNARTDVIIVKNSLRSESFELKKLLGTRPVEGVALPDFPLLSKMAYLAGNLELLRYDAQSAADEASWKVTRAAYLPTLTLDAAYGYTDYNGERIDYEGNRYNYGATLSMPLDVNSRGTIEASRLQALQTAVARTDRRMELEQEYDMRYATIGDYEEKIGVAQEMIAMYDELYRFTKDQVTAGYKSSYDLESLGNSVQIQKLEKQIQEFNIAVERIALYFDTQLYKEQ